MRHHEVAIRSSNLQVACQPHVAFISSRWARGGFPAAHARTWRFRALLTILLCAGTMFFVSALARKALSNPRSVQREPDIWKLYHLLHYFQQCGGKEVGIPRPKDVSFAKQYRAVYSAVTEQVRACARVIQNEWAELEAAYLSGVLDLIIRHVSRRV